MGCILHGSTRTRSCLRTELQVSVESTRASATRDTVKGRRAWPSGVWTATAHAARVPRRGMARCRRGSEEAIAMPFGIRHCCRWTTCSDVWGGGVIPNLSGCALQAVNHSHSAINRPKPKLVKA